MEVPPSQLDGGKVLEFARINSNTKETGNTVHRVTGNVVRSFAGLAICQLDQDGYYLFYCDAAWNVITDTLHDSIDKAKSQAAFEFDDIGDNWQKMPLD